MVELQGREQYSSAVLVQIDCINRTRVQQQGSKGQGRVAETVNDISIACRNGLPTPALALHPTHHLLTILIGDQAIL